MLHQHEITNLGARFVEMTPERAGAGCTRRAVIHGKGYPHPFGMNWEPRRRQTGFRFPVG
jgi:hypothetical protein